LKNWRVYLDLNNDGVWQRETEPSQRTENQASTPSIGYLQIKPANNGFYVAPITAEGFSVLNRDFGQKLLGLT